MVTATVAAGGLVGLLSFSAFLWTDLRERLELRDQLSQAKDHSVLLATSVDYITLIRPDPAALASMREEVAKLDQQLNGIDSNAVYEARAHLREIGYIMNHVLETESDAVLDQSVAGQLRLHQARVRDVLQHLSDTEDELYLQSLLRSIGWLLACGVLISLVSFAGFAWIYQRLKPPLRVLGSTIGKLASGDLSARTGLHTEDELGKLGRDIDSMAMRRQQDEDALRESEERFRQLTENINEIFWLKEVEGSHLLYISPSYETIFGLSRESAHEKPSSWLKALHPEDCDAVAESLSQQAPDHYELTYRIIRPDGEIRWLLDRAFPVRDSDGKVRRVAGLAEDVTREVVARNALKERVKELRCLYTTVDLTSRTDLTLAEICQGICDRIPESLLHDRDAEARIVIGNDLYESRQWQPPTASLDATIEVDGQPVGIVTAGYISGHPDQPEGEGPFLAEERALLNSIAAHLGKMLEKLQLEQNLQRASRLEAVGQLTGGVAHDFNNLLTVIMGSAELLLLRSDTRPPESDPAVMILSAAERGAELVRQMLAFARRQPLDPEPICLSHLVEEMRPLLVRTLGEGIGLNVCNGGTDCVAMVDRAQMESALLNLAFNSRDALENGGQVSIEIGTVMALPKLLGQGPEMAEGEYVRLAVSDTGSGMNEEQVARAFEPFFTTKEAGRGSGLGLSMVYGFAKQSRGHVELRSEPGKGTTVEIYLPCCHGGERQREVVQSQTIPGRGERILLVEDNDHVREFARQQLKSLGYDVVEAGNGHQALERLKEHADIDLLFTDFVMPGGMNGQQLVEAARAIHPGLKVLITSGYADIEELQCADVSLSLGLLPKPYKLSELSARLSRVLYGSSG